MLFCHRGGYSCWVKIDDDVKETALRREVKLTSVQFCNKWNY